MLVKLAFDVIGNGPPVVILHGLFGSGRNWASIAQALAGSYRLYLPDARNHGASPWVETMSYQDMALDVLDLIDREQLLRPVVIGHSMGGKTAMTLALEYSQAIAGVAVIDIAPEAYADQFSPYVAAMHGLDVAAATSRRDVRQALVSLLGVEAPVDFLMQNLQRHDERFDWRINLLATATCMRDLCDFPQHLLRRHYPGPALFVTGQHSAYVCPASRAEIVRLFPRARIQQISDAGHWVHADQPEALLKTLREWLAEIIAAPATS
jgi:pimeloyl-ACP methyl ester carboxylesterase